MAKFLTLNTHSWLEANSLKKLFDLAEHIYIEDYDVICLQEINQDIRGLLTKEIEGYEELPGSPELHRDNYALQLVNYLKSQGRHYSGLGLIIISVMTNTMRVLLSCQKSH